MSGNDQIQCDYCGKIVLLDNAFCDEDGSFYHQDCVDKVNAYHEGVENDARIDREEENE